MRGKVIQFLLSGFSLDFPLLYFSNISFSWLNKKEKGKEKQRKEEKKRKEKREKKERGEIILFCFSVLVPSSPLVIRSWVSKQR